MGGFIDETFPHSVNHLKLGKLGDFEVLLMACDDGDVIAYYTHRKDDRAPILSNLLLIRSCDISQRNMLTSHPPSALEGDHPRFELYRSTNCQDPAVSILICFRSRLIMCRFFHENVGKTAWGLAIHEKSRLIAVSSNLREVTVFCFGSSSAADITRVDLLEEEAMSRTEMFPLSTGLSSMAQISCEQLSLSG